MLGRGNIFEKISQLSFISEPTVHRVFHAICKRFAKELYHKWDVMPSPDSPELKEVLDGYH